MVMVIKTYSTKACSYISYIVNIPTTGFKCQKVWISLVNLGQITLGERKSKTIKPFGDHFWGSCTFTRRAVLKIFFKEHHLSEYRNYVTDFDEEGGTCIE